MTLWSQLKRWWFIHRNAVQLFEACEILEEGILEHGDDFPAHKYPMLTWCLMHVKGTLDKSRGRVV